MQSKPYYSRSNIIFPKNSRANHNLVSVLVIHRQEKQFVLSSFRHLTAIIISIIVLLVLINLTDNSVESFSILPKHAFHSLRKESIVPLTQITMKSSSSSSIPTTEKTTANDNNNRIDNIMTNDKPAATSTFLNNNQQEVITSYSMEPIRSVAIVGGTHGNEYTGVWIVRELELQQQKQLRQDPTAKATTTPDDNNTLYSSLNIMTLIGNPMAHVKNRRFMDVDLNRQFSIDTLSTNNATSTETTTNKIPLEVGRAHELNTILGPKQIRPNETTDTTNRNMDLIIDLHTTTAAMDVTLIIPEGDVLMIQAAAYVMYKCNEQYSASSFVNGGTTNRPDNAATSTTNTNIRFETRILIDHVRSCHSTRPFLPSMGKHEFTIEVGPVPQGLLRHDAIIKTKAALQYLLEFLELYNTDTSSSLPTILQQMYPDNAVPCFNDLGKIPWPSHPDNPNFPTYVIHNSVQDRDFQKVSKGDPLFVSLDGDTINYDGSYGDTIYLAFINEGGYYYSSSGTGICALMNATCSIQNGILIDF